MESSALNKLVLAGVCSAAFGVAFFSGYFFMTHFSDDTGDLLAEESENYDRLILNDPESERDEAEPPAPMPEPSVAEQKTDSAESTPPAEENIVAEREEVEEEAEEPQEEPEEEVVVENRYPVEAPVSLGRTPEEARDDILNDERLQARVPDTVFLNETGVPDTDNGSSADNTGSDTAAGNASNTPPAPPAVDNPGDGDNIPPAPGRPTVPGEGNVASLNLNLGEDAPGLGVALGTGNDGLGLSLAADLVSGQSSTSEQEDQPATPESGGPAPLLSLSLGGQDEAVPAAPEAEAGRPLLSVSLGAEDAVPAPVEEVAEPQQPITRVPSNDGRVMIGQNSLYNNALGGSVSGLIGGLSAPVGSERIQYRPLDAGTQVRHVAGGTITGVEHNTGANVLPTAVDNVANIRVNANLQSLTNQIPVVSPVVNGGGGNGGGISNAVPAGILPNVAVSAGGGKVISVNGNLNLLPDNSVLPNGVNLNAAGIKVNLNLGR